MGSCHACFQKSNQLLPEQSLGAPTTREKQSNRSAVRSGRRRSAGSSKINRGLPLEKLKAKKLGGLPSASERTHLLKAIQSHFMLRHLSEDSQHSVLNTMHKYQLNPEEFVIQQDTRGDFCFVLAKGRLEVFNDERRLKVLHPYVFVGDLALINNMARFESVKAVEKCFIWVLDRSSFTKAVQEVNDINYEENKSFLNNVALFEKLTEAQKEKVLEYLNSEKWERGETIVREGERGDKLFIIKAGSVVCTQKGKELRRMNQGEVFGEQALLHQQARTATITALTTVKLLSLSEDTLLDCFGDKYQSIVYKNSIRIGLENIDELIGLNSEQIGMISDLMTMQVYNPNEIVIPQGHSLSSQLWVVLQGRIGGTHIIKAHDYLGWLYEEGNFARENILADGYAVVATIQKDTIESSIGGSVKKVCETNKIIEVLQSVSLLNSLPPKKIASLAKSLESVEFQAGDAIFTEGQAADSFYIVKSGTVDVQKQGVSLRLLGSLSYFGERALLTTESRSATVCAHTKTVCWRVQQQHFLELIDENIHRQLLKRMALQNESVDLTGLVPISLLGNGMSSKVVLCRAESTNCYYALKVVTRQLIDELDLYAVLKAERNILLQLDHPMIMKLVRTFKDSRRIYFLTEFVAGDDQFNVLRKLGLLSEELAKFYTACLIFILEHLHIKKIVYRDLKPENIMIDEEGYPKLIDMGAAKVVNGKTYTTIGTPHYMAPEAILGAGYDNSVDWWSLGILIYEYLYGDVPFGAECQDPLEIYQAVIAHNLYYPMDRCIHQANQIIESLLTARGRAHGHISNMRKLQWLRDINWDGLITREVIPEFQPVVKELTSHEGSSESLARFLDTHERSRNRKIVNEPPGWDEEF